MAVNKALVDKGLMVEVTQIEEIKNEISRIDLGLKIETEGKLNSLLEDNWEDTTRVILKHIKEIELGKK